MPTIQHSALTSSELHEPKGANTASAGEVYVADGAGSGTWVAPPIGFCFYSNNTGTTISAPTSYTLLNPATATASTQRDVSHNSAGRLTYTGSETVGLKVLATMTLEMTASCDVDVVIALNGTPTSAHAHHTVQGASDLVNLTLLEYFDATNGDYIEVFGKCDAGDLKVLDLTMIVEGII